MHIGTVLTQKPGAGSVGLVTSPRLDPGRVSALAHGLIVAGLIVVLLIAGREILEPLVIAALLAFILSPLIRRLRQWGVWRAPSVVLAVLFALGVLGALSAIIAIQIAQLAEDLPTYETNLRNKIRTLGAGKLTSRALDRATGTLKDLQEEITKAGPAAPPRSKNPCWSRCVSRNPGDSNRSASSCVHCYRP